MLGGLAVLVALAAAYLSDCIPGLGTGGSVGVPSSETPATPAEPAKVEDAEAGEAGRLSIVVQGDRCRRGTAEPQPCDQLCAELDRASAGSTTVEIDASAGRHGAVEALRACLREAGFSDVRVRSE